MSRFDTLSGWLAWQETLHPNPIDLGLERVGEVAACLGLLEPQATVITVAGTNGKGSSIALLDAIYRAAGYRTCAYTSPHIRHYNERIRSNGAEVDNASLCRSFERIDSARGDITLTYFEFGTLAALDIFGAAQPDIIFLEVGLGGRLDAVNIVDTDVALVTAIDIDHSQWLGEDREAIGREKAGIFRPGRPAICSDARPPHSLQQQAQALGAQWLALGEDFSYAVSPGSWSWRGGGQSYETLALPNIGGRQQLDNAAGVIRVLEGLRDAHPVDHQAIVKGLQTVVLDGRCQVIPGPVEQVLDVAHNPASARQLARFLAERPVTGHTWMVLGMLADKDPCKFVAELEECVDHWCLAGLTDVRGLSAQQLRERLPPAGDRLQCFDDVAAALRDVMAMVVAGDRVVISGSFVTVAAALASQV